MDITYLLRSELQKDVRASRKLFPPEVREATTNFHKQIPLFKPTDLVSLPTLAKELKVGGIWVKNEAQRLGLNSFKPLGGSFALYRFIQERLNIGDEKMSWDFLVSDEVKKRLGEITFASATDGNHGKGIAWASKQLGHKCEIYVHSDTSQERIDAIAQYGATVTVVQGNYDDAVRQVALDAKKNGWEIISDTSWPGYSQVPTWIMQGYATMMGEIQNQLASHSIEKPTHVFVQAGVGALAAAVMGYYHSLFEKGAPISVIIEPERAACLLESAKKGDGKAHGVSGGLETIMAGLSCGEPSEVAWHVLDGIVDAFITAPDYIAARGMRMLAAPLGTDSPIVSGESGSVGIGMLYSIVKDKRLSELKETLKIDEKSHLLFINSEGDTDPIHYRQIVWEGSCPTPEEHLLGRF